MSGWSRNPKVKLGLLALLAVRRARLARERAVGDGRRPPEDAPRRKRLFGRSVAAKTKR